MSHALSKSISQQTDIVKSVKQIARVAGCSEDSENLEPITLRASGELLHGVVRVYSKKTSLLLNDIKDTLTRMTALFRTAQQPLTLQVEKTTLSNPSQYLLQDAVTEREVLLVPGLEFLNEQAIPRGFMENERSMERHVQGAAPWDSSIEVGRNARMGDDLGFDRSSTLDLDFDLDNTETKAWGEGTNTTINKSTQTNSAIIEEDDFPIYDNDDWDLGVRDQSVDAPSGDGNDRSIEVGRRATATDVQEERTEFDFDLELEKDPEDRNREGTMEPEQLATPPMSSPPRRNLSRPDSKHFRRLITDDETELRDELAKISEVPPDSQIIEGDHEALSHIQEKKRLWTQVSESVNYLPRSILNNLTPYQDIKRSRISTEAPQVIEVEPQIEASLAFDDELMMGQDDLPEIEPPMSDAEDAEAEDENELANGTSVSMDMHEFSNVEPTTSQSQDSDSQKIKLATGEVISRDTNEMAEQLKMQFLDSETLTFSGCLEHGLEGTQENSEITKKQACKTFFELLSLANMGCVDLNQETEFGEIEVTGKASLYNKLVVA